MASRLVTPPAEEPVTLAEAKAHLRVEHDAEDGAITGYIAAARQYVEDQTGRALLTQTWDLVLPALPAAGWVELPKAPLQSVTSVTYTAEDGSTATLPESEYTVGIRSGAGLLARAYGVTWPAVRAGLDAVIVRYVAGWASRDEVPAALRQAVLLRVGDYYAGREDVVTGTVVASTGAVDALLSPWRVDWL